MKKEKEYIPFGEEWDKEMMRWSKKDLINLLKKKLKELRELKAATALLTPSIK